MAVGDPRVFFYELRDGSNSSESPHLIQWDAVGMEGLALGGLDKDGRVERVEKALSDVADAVVHTEHNDERRGADGNANQRYPRDKVDDSLLLAREEVSAGYEQVQWHGLTGL